MGGRAGPSDTLLGSFLAAVASAGFMSAAAEMTFEFVGFEYDDDDEFVGRVGVVGVAGEPSAFRFLLGSLLEMGFMSCAERVSVVA